MIDEGFPLEDVVLRNLRAEFSGPEEIRTRYLILLLKFSNVFLHLPQREIDLADYRHVDSPT
jgi:hypothetical protein